MRESIFVLLIAFCLAPVVRAQQPREIALEWKHDVTGVSEHLTPEETQAWNARQNDRYLGHFEDKLKFWKFKPVPANPEQAILRMVVATDGVGDITARAEIELPQSSPETFWRGKVMTKTELDSRLGRPAPQTLNAMSRQLDKQFIEDNFRGNIKPLYQHAWIAESILDPLTDGKVGLPLPWDRLKKWAYSKFEFDCDDAMGRLVLVKGDGVACPYIKANSKYLATLPLTPLNGLKVRRIRVFDPLEREPSNCNFEIIP